MPAIFNPKRTIYACNLFQLGPNMPAMSKLVMEPRDYDWTNFAETNFRLLQTYLVPFEKDCKHMWSISILRLQAYLVSFKTEIASV